jgi:hypothetical protein
MPHGLSIGQALSPIASISKELSSSKIGIHFLIRIPQGAAGTANGNSRRYDGQDFLDRPT